MADRLQGKVALVTGAGSGLGEATARRFAAEGARVYLTDVTEDAVRSVADSIGAVASARYQDVTDEAAWDTLTQEIISESGQLDVVVNNAGIALTGSAEDTSLEDWRAVQAVNLDAVFLGTRAAIKVMKSRGGSIINISSIEGIIGEPRAAAYNASKGGVRIFTKSAALHCAAEGYGIRVNSVHPGFILTPMVEQGLGALPPEELEAMEARIMAEIPLGAMGEPDDIAAGCLFLASDESKYMTGSELVIDGGYTAH
ncbi:MAG: glucose 1-dehydrogenase [Halieaceae bacterium]|jgi:NAD(P)-dependent dehydrogenase (short-subunit alcohol dehydrogenase family)|nr:glucose 1-dehydrogenase [Halieaceae bacterium]